VNTSHFWNFALPQQQNCYDWIYEIPIEIQQLFLVLLFKAAQAFKIPSLQFIKTKYRCPSVRPDYPFFALCQLKDIQQNLQLDILDRCNRMGFYSEEVMQPRCSNASMSCTLHNCSPLSSFGQNCYEKCQLHSIPMPKRTFQSFNLFHCR
jgi:hypothetical protein